MTVDEIYTPLEEAKKEIWKRWNDPELKKKVEKFLGGDIPHFFKNEPRAALVRDIASPNNEFFYFWDLMKETGIKPVLVEYSSGKFVAKNINKYHLCRMYFHHGVGKHGGGKIECTNVVNFNTEEGKKMGKVRTIWNESIVDFHHDFLKNSVPEVNKEDIVDFSKWFDKHKKETKYWYLHYLALFLCYGILFDNFILDNGEREFTEKKILPSLKKLVEKFGIKPLIVPIAPFDSENDLFWWLYPGHTRGHICLDGKDKK
ncbi:MAG: hypothetical protein WCO10_02920 [bacterium]